jgi:hypothetical protein
MNEIDAKPSLDLSLYHLDRDLAGLIEYRQERIADTADPPSEDELKALELEIRRYLEALPKKVSGTVAVVRHWRSQRMAAKQEIDRLKAIVAHLDSMEARLLEYCGEVLEHQPEPKKGCRKLVGADGSTISLKGNGGVQPLEVYNPDILPDELVRRDFSLSGAEWRELRSLMMIAQWNVLLARIETSMKRSPDNEAIRKVLSMACFSCGGVPPLTEDVPECGSCGGSGKQGVPGARLLERGKHVEIK